MVRSTMAIEDRRQIRAIVRSLENLAERVVRKITLDVTANLVFVTPLQNGMGAGQLGAVRGPPIR